MKYDKEWYKSLAKPKFQPPDEVFAPVWIFLYMMMSVSFILVLLSPFRLFNILAYLFFIVQFLVNLAWMPAFFIEHNLRKAFLLAALLTFLVFATMLIFFKISIFAGVLFLPYFLWCCFATVLAFEILERNEW